MVEKGLPAREKKKAARKEIRRLALRSVNRSTRGKGWKTRWRTVHIRLNILDYFLLAV